MKFLCLAYGAENGWNSLLVFDTTHLHARMTVEWALAD